MPRKKVAIIGAGPVGALSALYFSHAGWDVQLYEMRSDLRAPHNLASGTGKSINLALSERGINGLRHLGDDGHLLTEVLASTIPMYGRMIHNGSIHDPGEAQNYDPVHGRFIRSVDRAQLNRALLDACEAREGVEMLFGHKLVGMELDGCEGAGVRFEVYEEMQGEGEGGGRPGTRGRVKRGEEEVVVDLVVGADGAHSKVRDMMMRYVQMYYEQTYLPTLWCEFQLPALPADAPAPTAASPPPRAHGKTRPALSPHHLHIWPASPSMFIAIPSLHNTFTCTLFAPTSTITALTTPALFTAYISGTFPDLIPLFGEKSLIDQFFTNQHLPLISIRTSPYHYTSRCVLLGDAAHAMVPFYGQGMNAGFESVRILAEKLAVAPTVEAGLDAYSAERMEDAWAIVDLAMRNHEEMRSGVVQWGYLARKWMEEGLSQWAPWCGVRTLYSMVSFGNERYSVVRERERWQAWVEGVVARGVLGVVGVGIAWRFGVGRALWVGTREAWRAL